LFFANAEHVRQRLYALAAGSGATLVVLDAQTVPFIDVTATTMLRQLAGRLHREGITLAVARDIGQVRDVLDRTHSTDRVLAFPTIDAAVASAGTG
jgi:MFS superfamily sulfate permease-like transporter